MIPSRKIEDYREVALEELPLGRETTFRLFIYLKSNNHIMTWRGPGISLDAEQIGQSLERGIKKLWIHESEWNQYLAFTAAESEATQALEHADTTVTEAGATAEAPEPLASTTPAEHQDRDPNDTPEIAKTEPEDLPRLHEGELLKRVLKSTVLSQAEKKTVTSALSQTMLERISKAPTEQHQKQELKRARRMMSSIIDRLAESVHEDVRKIWDLAQIDAHLQHGVNVATFSALFAMAFGRIDEELLSDIALAGLVHDLGISHIRPSVAALPVTQHSTADTAELQTHVESSVELLAAYLPESSERVTAMVRQHQELFDGTGYPEGLEGFDFDDIAQLVAMADLAESVRVGLWDGHTRSFKEAFELIEGLEQSKTFPHFFNPEVFRQVVSWTRREGLPESLEQASRSASSQAKRIMQP